MKTRPLYFSMGKNKFDNTPKQHQVENFEAFETTIRANRSRRKGEIYFCAGMHQGSHPNQAKFPSQRSYRLASLAMARRFICLDHDSYASPEILKMLLDDLQAYRGFAYQTWTSTQASPRARIVLEIDREVDRAEGIALCESFDQVLLAMYGSDAIKTDPSVYRAEQPCYAPGHQTAIYKFEGDVLGANSFLGGRHVAT